MRLILKVLKMENDFVEMPNDMWYVKFMCLIYKSMHIFSYYI